MEDKSSGLYHRAMPEDRDNSEKDDSNGSKPNDDNDGLIDGDLMTLGLKVTDMEHFDIERETYSQHFSEII